jgi:hypothetical protein
VTITETETALPAIAETAPVVVAQPLEAGVFYTSQGAMTAQDLHEYRLDTDWYELHRHVPQDDECDHCRLWTDDCDDCERY